MKIKIQFLTKMFLLLFAGAMLAVPGCGKKKATDLTIEFTSDNNYVIDATSASCGNEFDYKWAVYDYQHPPGNSTTAPELPTFTTGGTPGPYLSLGQMSLTWNSPKANTVLLVVYVRFDFSSSLFNGTTYTYTLADQELFKTWRWNERLPGNPALDTDLTNRATVDPGVTQNGHLSDCTVRIPSFPILNKKVSGSGSGKVFVYAVERSDSGQETPIVTSALVNFRWLGLGN